MAYEIKNNTGTFFNNKKTSPKSPCFKGYCVIDGKKLQVAIWERVSASGASYWNMRFEDDKSTPKVDKPKENVLNDDIPWN